MLVRFVVLGLLATTPVWAQGIERTARPVVDPTRDLERMMMVPTCAPGTPVAVSGTRFVCGKASTGTWGAWKDVTKSRVKDKWYQNDSDRGLWVHVWGWRGTWGWVSPDGNDANGIEVASRDGDSGEWGQADFLVPPHHWYKIGIEHGQGIASFAELQLPF